MTTPGRSLAEVELEVLFHRARLTHLDEHLECATGTAGATDEEKRIAVAVAAEFGDFASVKRALAKRSHEEIYAARHPPLEVGQVWLFGRESDWDRSTSTLLRKWETEQEVEIKAIDLKKHSCAWVLYLAPGVHRALRPGRFKLATARIKGAP